MTHVHKILEAAVAPETLKQIYNRLGDISDTILKLRDRGEMTPAMDRDHDALLDLMWHVGLHMGERSLEDANGEFPKTDHLTMIKAAETYKIIDRQTARGLRAEFMKSAARIVGHDLTPAQVKALHKLFRTHNPAAQMLPDEPKP